MEIPQPFTAYDLKYHLMQQIQKSRTEHNVPLAAIAHYTHMKTIDDLWGLMDPKNIDISLKELVELSHCVGLSIHISFD